jgi:hypothetical protein
MSKNTEQYFSKENIQMGTYKKYSASLIIKEMQVSTTMRHFCRPIRTASIKKMSSVCKMQRKEYCLKKKRKEYPCILMGM